MSVKLTLGEVDAIISSSALKDLLDKSPRVEVGYQINKITKKLIEEHNLFVEKRAEILKEYAEKDENGEIKQIQEGDQVRMTVPTEKLKEFNEKVIELVGIEVDMDVNPLKLSKVQDLEIPVRNIMILDKLIVDDLN
jgi:hypothetical protein